MADKQLNIWIPEDLKVYLASRAEQEKQGMNSIVSDLIREDMARRSGAIVEEQSLPVIREIVASELRQMHAQLRRDLRFDREREADVFRDFLLKQVNRLVGLIVQAIRNASYAYRFGFTLIAREHGRDYALATLNDAKEKTDQELFKRKQSEV